MLKDLINRRKAKLKNFYDSKINPYPDSSTRTHLIQNVFDNFLALESENAKIILAGRIRSIRAHGGSTFIHLEDESGKIQAYFKQDKLGRGKYKFFKNFDVGDFIEVSGKVFTTQKGEKTLLALSYQILSKSLRPLPEKWQGLQDQEVRFRERYLDLIVNENVRERFRKRARIIDSLRDFLTDRGFLEVDTPVLQTKASGALARPFITEHEALSIPLYLRIAPETYLKRLIVGGFEKVFEMARVFRNEGMDTAHLQDFTMLEFYWAYQNYEFLMRQTEEMFIYVLDRVFNTLKIKYQGEEIDFTPPWPRVSFQELILRDCGIDLSVVQNVDSLKQEIENKKITIKNIDQLGFGNLVDQLYKKVSRPKLKGPIFLTGHPIDLSPLARRNDKNPRIVDRFQLVVLGQELVNAYSELVDPIDQKKRFEAQDEARLAGDTEAHVMDDDYLRAMEYGMPPIAGWGMGIDRLVMFLTDAPSIREAVFFPLMRPQNPQNICPATQKDLQSENLKVDPNIDRENAWQLVCDYVKNENSRKHMLATEIIMLALARNFQADEKVWDLTGLLHDLDMEIVDYRKEPEKHGIKTAEILTEKKVNSVIVKACSAHNEYNGSIRETRLQKAIYATDPLTGLIAAAALVLPSKKLADLTPESVLKRFKEKSFAQGARREVIASCESFGISLAEFVKIGLQAMQSIAVKLGL